MRFKCFYLLLHTLLLQCTATVPVQTARDFLEESLLVRVRRQDGYVYNKPSVSFDLPQRSTPAPTQAPNVDRTLTQQMYYAYPVPAGGDTVSIGQTASTTTTAAAATPTAAGKYNYRASTTGNAAAGYSYGTSTGAQANSGAQVTNTGSQTAFTATQTAGTTQAGSGYGYNAPSSTLSPTRQGSLDGSTSAPKYLPPTAGGTGGSIAMGGNVNIGGVSVTSGNGQVTYGTSTSVQAGPIGTPSDTYLSPNLGTSNTATSGQTVTLTSTSAQTNTGGSISIPSSAYLPPKTSPPAPSQSPSPQPAPAPTAGYIPPSEPNSGTVSTPASMYLPPSSF